MVIVGVVGVTVVYLICPIWILTSIIVFRVTLDMFVAFWYSSVPNNHSAIFINFGQKFMRNIYFTCAIFNNFRKF